MQPSRYLVVCLCAVLMQPLALPKTEGDGKLTSTQAIDHALNRLTFGPRPGDQERVAQIGLKKWIDQQLHPERVPDNPILMEKLRPLASINMSPELLAREYPSPAMVVAVATGKAPMPSNPAERAKYERLIERYRNRIDKKINAQGNKTADQASDGAGAEKKAEQAINDQDSTEPRRRLDDVLSPSELTEFRRAPVDGKGQFLSGLRDDRLESVLEAMPPQQRRALYATATPELRSRLNAFLPPQQVLSSDLQQAKVLRSIYSDRQLEEVLTDFWFNHFNVFLNKGADRFLITSYEREAIRPHVLGRFRDLLTATAESPAMLFYLDNWESVAPDAQMPALARVRPDLAKRKRGLNENYARELLELHTLGVDGGYTQQDIINVARCFTGWTIRQPQRGGEFFFNPRMHDRGEKTVLGVRIPAGGGIDDGYRVLDILVQHPSTAKFLSRKLAIRFVADNPPIALIDRMAKTYLSSKGDLREVMKTMLESREFWTENAWQKKVKSPLEMVVSAVRATNADVTFAQPLVKQIADLGQPLYQKLEPTGYSNSNEEWLNSSGLLARMNFAVALTGNKLPGVSVTPDLWKPEQFGGPAFQKR